VVHLVAMAVSANMAVMQDGFAVKMAGRSF
jgi:hypothetical protein